MTQRRGIVQNVQSHDLLGFLTNKGQDCGDQQCWIEHFDRFKMFLKWPIVKARLLFVRCPLMGNDGQSIFFADDASTEVGEMMRWTLAGIPYTSQQISKDGHLKMMRWKTCLKRRYTKNLAFWLVTFVNKILGYKLLLRIGQICWVGPSRPRWKKHWRNTENVSKLSQRKREKTIRYMIYVWSIYRNAYIYIYMLRPPTYGLYRRYSQRSSSVALHPTLSFRNRVFF